MGSTIPAVKANLVALLLAASWPQFDDSEKVTVTYGGVKEPPRLQVAVTDTQDTGEADQAWSTLGDQNRDERYALGVHVVANVPGQTQQVATERAFAIFAVVESTVKGAPRLIDGSNDPGLIGAELVRGGFSEYALDTEGYGTHISSAVRCRARL